MSSRRGSARTRSETRRRPEGVSVVEKNIPRTHSRRVRRWCPTPSKGGALTSPGASRHPLQRGIQERHLPGTMLTLPEQLTPPPSQVAPKIPSKPFDSPVKGYPRNTLSSKSGLQVPFIGMFPSPIPLRRGWPAGPGDVPFPNPPLKGVARRAGGCH